MSRSLTAISKLRLILKIHWRIRASGDHLSNKIRRFFQFFWLRLSWHLPCWSWCMFERTLSSMVSYPVCITDCFFSLSDCNSLSDNETGCKSLLKMPKRFSVVQQVRCSQQHWLVAHVWATHVRMWWNLSVKPGQGFSVRFTLVSGWFRKFGKDWEKYCHQTVI